MNIKFNKNRKDLRYLNNLMIVFLLLFIFNICNSCNLNTNSNDNSFLHNSSSIDNSNIAIEGKPIIRNNIDITINLVLPNYIYNNKDELFYDFFGYFYNYIINTKNGLKHLKKYNINSVDDLYRICKTWDDDSSMGLPDVGFVLGDYFMHLEVGSNFILQKQYDTFVSYCLNNNKFIDFLYFDKKFFYHFRKDEGYTGSVENGKNPLGSDFFASPFASIVDTAKFFYYTKESLPPFIIMRKNVPKLYDMIPGVLKKPFYNKFTIYYNLKNNIPYVLPHNFDCYGFDFVGYYMDKNYSSKMISQIDNDFILNNNLDSKNNSITLYARFKRSGVFADEINNDFPE